MSDAKKIMSANEAALARSTPEGAHWLLVSHFEEDGTTTVAASPAFLAIDVPEALRKLATAIEKMRDDAGGKLEPMIVVASAGGRDDKGRPS